MALFRINKGHTLWSKSVGDNSLGISNGQTVDIIFPLSHALCHLCYTWMLLPIIKFWLNHFFFLPQTKSFYIGLGSNFTRRLHVRHAMRYLLRHFNVHRWFVRERKGKMQSHKYYKTRQISKVDYTPAIADWIHVLFRFRSLMTSLKSYWRFATSFLIYVHVYCQ